MTTREHAALGRAFVDLANQRVEMSAANFSGLPPIYKRYPRAGRVPLPAEPGGDTLRSPRELGRLLRDVNGLSAMLWGRGLLDLGGRSEDRRPPDPTLVRHVPAGGARYPVELYAAVGPLGSLPAGLYHYDPRHHALDRLRSGDPRAAVVDSLGSPPDPFPDLVLLFSVVLWRGAAKYGEFAYRLQSLDLGVVVGQALAAAGALCLDGAVHLLFADPALDGLLGLSAPAESVLAVVTLSGAGGTAPGGPVSSAPPPAAESPG
ncbi:MAG: SagB/ThcOx family dehydrogenase, partial [Spirillospora sp.]